ncbi:MAG: hypothetical protein PHG02_00680 [Oscillospiraceae bacterium]|nr:hypothetical protein [Oscillospiraceae bacterium]
MSGRKAFFLSLIISLGVIVPVYTVFVMMHIANDTPVEQQNVSVPITTPQVGDSKNLLFMTGEEKDIFVLLRFDALQNKISVAALPANTVVLNGGKAVTISQALSYAGPALINQTLQDTLTLKIDDYLYVPPDILESAFAGQISAPLSMEDMESLNKNLTLLRQFAFNGGVSTLSPASVRQLLTSDSLDDMDRQALRAKLYAAFLTGTCEQLYKILPTLMRGGGEVRTSVKATDIYNYERICKYFLRAAPTVEGCVIPGELHQDRYELNETALNTMQRLFT